MPGVDEVNEERKRSLGMKAALGEQSELDGDNPDSVCLPGVGEVGEEGKRSLGTKAAQGE